MSAGSHTWFTPKTYGSTLTPKISFQGATYAPIPSHPNTLNIPPVYLGPWEPPFPLTPYLPFPQQTTTTTTTTPILTRNPHPLDSSPTIQYDSAATAPPRSKPVSHSHLPSPPSPPKKKKKKKQERENKPPQPPPTTTNIPPPPRPATRPLLPRPGPAQPTLLPRPARTHPAPRRRRQR